MTPENFCYWLQGFFEMGGGAQGLTPEQVAMVREHLQLVFTKETKMGPDDIASDICDDILFIDSPPPTSPFNRSWRCSSYVDPNRDIMDPIIPFLC